MVDMTTREAAADDYPRLLALWQEQSAIASQLDPRLNAVVSDPPTLPPQVEGAAVLVVEIDGEIIGFIQAQPAAENAYTIENIVIDAHSRAGLGSVLLDALVAHIKPLGVQAVTAAAPRYHAVQQAFWRAKGASVIQETFYLSLKSLKGKS